MYKKQTNTIVSAEATPMPDQIETMPEPVKNGPKLFHFPDPQEIIGNFVDAFVSDEGANSYDDLIVKAWLSESYERSFLGRKATAKTGVRGVRYTDGPRRDDPGDEYILMKAKEVVENNDQSLQMAVLVGFRDGHIDSKHLSDMIIKYTNRKKPNDGGRMVTTLTNMNIVDQVDGKNVIHKPELLRAVFEDSLKKWSIKWGLSEAVADGGNADV
jgi:hypothetical protein